MKVPTLSPDSGGSREQSRSASTMKHELRMSKLTEAIELIQKRHNEARRMECERENNAVNAVMPVVNLLHDTFDNLGGWDKPSYCSGVATYRCWIEGTYGSVHMVVDSRTPERVIVHRSASNGASEVPVSTFPTTEEGLAFMVMAIAERMTLANASEMITAP